MFDLGLGIWDVECGMFDLGIGMWDLGILLLLSVAGSVPAVFPDITPVEREIDTGDADKEKNEKSQAHGKKKLLIRYCLHRQVAKMLCEEQRDNAHADDLTEDPHGGGQSGGLPVAASLYRAHDGVHVG